MLRLPLDVSDPLFRGRLESTYSAAFALRRALQGDARRRVRAYRCALHERKRRGPRAVRERLGLTRAAFERAAYRHLDRAPHLRRFVTKALAMHVADAAWNPVERHLFPDASGKRQGLLHVGRWFDFAKLPGRARSHTTARKWETFRLHGTLAGHRAAYARERGCFFQPRRMRPIVAPDSWWSHEGPLAIVFSGLGVGELVLPVRLPSAPSNQPILEHHLADPERWHKVDLVRRRDPNTPGGWKYEAHLMVLVEPYSSLAANARRELAAIETRDRRAGIDVNVSNVSVASHKDGDDFLVSRIARDAGEHETERLHAKKRRRRQRALDRSRRAANPAHYQLSARQLKRAQRYRSQGRPAPQGIPLGSRCARADGKPLQAYWRDELTNRYRRERAAQACEAAAMAQAKRALARQIAASLVSRHGFHMVVEDCSVAAWSRTWGRSLAAFSPGRLLAEVEREASRVATLARVAGGLVRVSTRATALSQHCLCGSRVSKTLAQRQHVCAACGLAGDRDAVSATLASFVTSGRVDFDASRASVAGATAVLARALQWSIKGRQDAPSESTAHSASRASCARDPGRTSFPMMARRNAEPAPHPTPDEPGSKSRTKSERARMRNSLPRDGATLPPLRDSS